MKKLYILMVAILIGTTFSFGQNLSSNGGFENWTAGVPDGWTTIDFNTTDLTEETTTFSEGSKSAKINLITQNQGDTDIKQEIALTAGTTYNVSLKVYATDNQAKVRLFAPSYSPSVYSNPDTLNEWQTLSFEYTPTTTGNAAFGMRFYDISANWTGGNSVFYIDDFIVEAQTGPSLAITSPANGDTLPSGDAVTVSFTATNFNIGATGSDDGHIHCVVDGDTANPIMKFNNSPFVLTGLTDGQHTAYLELVDNNHNPISPAVNQTVTFTLASFTQVADIAALRAGNQGDFYELTGEAFINYAQTYRGQKYIQDDTAGILIDDTAGNIPAGQRGDGLSNIKGTLGEHKGMLQFVPTMNATVVSPSSLTITPQVITLADLTTNFEDYEAELVTVKDVMIANTTPGDNYENGTIYPMSAGGDTFNFRTSFYDVDYIGTAVHTVTVDVTGLPNEKTGTEATDFGVALSARDSADIVVHTATVTENAIKGFTMYPNPTKNVLNITTAQNLTKNVQIFDILGKQVVNTNLNGTTLNVANLNAGLYLIKVQEAGNSVTRKLVIK